MWIRPTGTMAALRHKGRRSKRQALCLPQQQQKQQQQKQQQQQQQQGAREAAEFLLLLLADSWYLSASEAQQIDAELMGPSVGYRLEQDLLRQAREHGAQVFEDLPTERSPWEEDHDWMASDSSFILRGLRVEGLGFGHLSPYSVLVDAIFGFSFRGPLRAPYLELIQKAKATRLPVFSVDVPSGCDVDSS
ncbi:hypothetical protein Emag_006560 [Eimeria magna]